ncbi:MAG: Ca-activated chloride channel family protein [Flavobacteriales bacterium]|jgi:Ca-activated chloride channel family protein
MNGVTFTRYTAEQDKRSPFERLKEIFFELLTHTSGDIDEAMDWMEQLDKEHGLTDDKYTLEDFYNELRQKGYLREESDKGKGGGGTLTEKTEQAIRKRALDQVFGKLKKGQSGKHVTQTPGKGQETTENRRRYNFGDRRENIDFSQSLRNAQINQGLGDKFRLTENDLEVAETLAETSTSTVLMIDISHSMILYGEDRITPAKKVAMALSELIMTRYAKDTLDIVVFGNDAWEIQVKDLPYLTVGPYHTNTVAGLERAMDILRRRKTSNKQIFMITDGKPSCLKENGEYYKNSWGLDPYITGKCFNLARACRKAGISITTFMIASDPHLQEFVEDFTEANKGKAFYTGLQGLGDTLFDDFEKNRRRNI